jgi:uncharacterized protein YoxC
MSDVNSVLLSILLILGCGLVVVVTAMILRVTRTVDALQQEIRQLNGSVVPLLERVNALAEDVQGALARLSEHDDALADTLGNFRAVSRNVRNLEEMLQEQIEPSLRAAATLIGSIRRGLESFVRSWAGPRR